MVFVVDISLPPEMTKRDAPTEETVPLACVPLPGLSPLVSWPCVMADSASRACDAALLACCGFDPSRPHRCLTAHAGIRAQVDSDQSGKCQSPPAAGCQAVTRVERGFSGRSCGRCPWGHTSVAAARNGNTGLRLVPRPAMQEARLATI